MTTIPAGIGSTNADAMFKPGEIIDFCGDRFEIVANHGISGLVKPLDGSGHVIRFLWVFEGEPARRVS